MDGKSDLMKKCSDCGVLKRKRTFILETTIKTLEKKVLNVQKLIEEYIITKVKKKLMNIEIIDIKQILISV